MGPPRLSSTAGRAVIAIVLIPGELRNCPTKWKLIRMRERGKRTGNVVHFPLTTTSRRLRLIVLEQFCSTSDHLT